MDLDSKTELVIYRRDAWRCIHCGSTVDLRVYRHGEPSADHPRSYGTFCAYCVERMPRL